LVACEQKASIEVIKRSGNSCPKGSGRSDFVVIATLRRLFDVVRGFRDQEVSQQSIASTYKILYIHPMTDSTKLDPKPVEFRGSSLDDLRAFPPDARREAGHQLDLVQNGLDPDDWKSMAAVGSGAQEIRIRDETGAYRVIYVAKFDDAIYVLHCFQKKTEQTSKPDIDLAEKRYRELKRELKK
jgi:phage-related protein